MEYTKKDGRFIPWKSTTEMESEVKKKKKRKGLNQDPNIQTMIFKFSIMAFRTTWTYVERKSSL